MYIAGEKVLYLPYLVCYGLMGGEMKSGAINCWLMSCSDNSLS